MFLKEREEEREEEEEEDISLYWRKFKEARRSWKLKEEILDRPAGRTRFGSGYGPVERQTT